MYLVMYFFTNCKPSVIRHNLLLYVYVCIFISLGCVYFLSLLAFLLYIFSFTVLFFNTETLCPILNLSFLNCTS